jgi:7,8-dihydropterin-6-yl-methyl-4-(beta-D-ribofuranosyl)aminobenzene 5'-phosphate synthase
MTAATTVTILMDNESAPGLASEWGFAAAIRQDGRFWLWDTGQSAAFLANAALLGIAPQEADGLALSHGHYDHTGGVTALLNAGYHGPIFAHPDFARQRFNTTKTPVRPIGIPCAVPEFTEVEQTCALTKSITMVTGIPRLPNNFQATKGFFFDESGNTPDPVNDDAFLVLDTPRGTVVLLGCCHSGLMNSLLCMKDRLGIASVHAVIGGLHLFNADRKALEETVEACRMFRVQQLVPGHCTGPDAPGQIQTMLKNCETVPMKAGLSLDYPA